MLPLHLQQLNLTQEKYVTYTHVEGLEEEGLEFHAVDVLMILLQDDDVYAEKKRVMDEDVSAGNVVIIKDLVKVII